MPELKGQYDLNKTLPLPPGVQEFSVRAEQCVGGSEPPTPSCPHFESGKSSGDRLSNASTSQSSKTHSTTSSRGRLRFVTRDMITSGFLQDRVDSLTNLSTPNFVEPIKYDPTNSTYKGAISPRSRGHSYAKSMDSPLSNAKWLPPVSTSTLDSEEVSSDTPHAYPCIPQSRSEGRLDSNDDPRRGRTAQYFIPSYLLPGKGSPKRQSNGNRSLDRTERSPVRQSEMLDEKPDDHHIDTLEWPTPTRKRSRSPHKMLFGENGWLSRSKSMKEIATNSQTEKENNDNHKKAGLKIWGEKVKLRFDDKQTSPTKSSASRAESKKAVAQEIQSTSPISLHPSTQSTIYADLELLLTTQTNRFLLSQHAQSLISAASVTRVIQFWQSKNRPQVLEFMFDQATQRELIVYNLSTLRFSTAYHDNPVKMNSVLHQWKALAKQMAIRTFCNPDSMVRQHVRVTRKVCEMIDAHEMAFRVLGEIERLMGEEIAKREGERRERKVRMGTPRGLDIEDLVEGGEMAGAECLGEGDDTLWEDPEER